MNENNNKVDFGPEFLEDIKSIQAQSDAIKDLTEDLELERQLFEIFSSRFQSKINVNAIPDSQLSKHDEQMLKLRINEIKSQSDLQIKHLKESHVAALNPGYNFDEHAKNQGADWVRLQIDNQRKFNLLLKSKITSAYGNSVLAESKIYEALHLASTSSPLADVKRVFEESSAYFKKGAQSLKEMVAHISSSPIQAAFQDKAIGRIHNFVERGSTYVHNVLDRVSSAVRMMEDSAKLVSEMPAKIGAAAEKRSTSFSKAAVSVGAAFINASAGRVDAVLQVLSRSFN